MSFSERFSSIRRLGLRSSAFGVHIFQKITGLTIGQIFVSPIGKLIRSKISNFHSETRNPNVKIAIVAHVYYPDIIPEILECRSILPVEVSLHITTPPDKIKSVYQALSGATNIYVHSCENRGRDIWPFIQLLQSGALDGYDAVLKLHTKRSPHLLDGEVRRKLLFAMLCGERRATLQALTAFEKPETGLVGWRASWREAPQYWMANRDCVERLSERMGVTRSALRLGFFEGSMFWFRPAALATLRSLSLSQGDFEAEAGQVDGTLHHAIERCFTIAAWSGGFQVRDLKGKLLEGFAA